MIMYNNCSMFGPVFSLDFDDKCDYFEEVLDMFNELKDKNGEIKLEFTNKEVKSGMYDGAIREVLYNDGKFTLKRLGEFLYAVYDGDEPLMIEECCDAMLYSIWVKLKQMKS